MIFRRIFNNFLFGELSPRMSARVDLEMYTKGAKTLENVIVSQQGGVSIRPGTRFVRESSVATTSAVRTLTFTVNDTESFILEIGAGKAYFYKDHDVVMDGASVFFLTVPWTGDQVTELKYVKIDKALYISHQSHAIRKITYGGSSDIDWSISTPTFTGTTFSASGDYPKAIAYWGQRLILANTVNEPTTIWMSKVGDVTEFTIPATPADDDPKEYELNSDSNDAINWICSGASLIAGTLSGEWLISDTAALKQTTYGSSQMQAKLVNNFIFFLQRAKRRLREYYYQDQNQAYVAADLSAASDHITKPAIVDMDFQNDPDSIVWMIRSDGELVGLSRDQGQGNIAWHRHTTDGEFETVAVIPTATYDEVWVTTLRDIGGVTKRYIEYFESREFDSQEDAYHVDCGVTSSGVDITSVSGLTHLEGKTVKVVVDGGPHPDRVVSSGAITLQSPTQKAHVGLFNNAIVEPMPIALPGQTLRIVRVFVRVFETLGMSVGGELIDFREAGTLVGAPPDLFTGDKEVIFPGLFDTNGLIEIRQTQPLPFSLLGIAAEVEMADNEANYN